MNKISFLITGALFFSAMSVVAQAPKVAHIWPNAGLNEQSITASIHGDNFQTVPVTSVILTRSGFPDIFGSSISVVSEVYLTCSFDLTGESSGLYDLVAENASGADTLPGCLTVYSASPFPYVWERTFVGYGTNVMYGVAVGDGNGDGEIEVYGASWGDSIYQFKWDGISWQKTILGAGAGYMWGVAVGDGNGDGEIEVYGANADSSLYQFKWDGITWQKTTLGAGPHWMWGVAVGDGDGDGEIEVYCGAQGIAFQFKWDGITWQKTTVGEDVSLGIAVGDGNGDGEMEVYGSSDGMNMYQFKPSPLPHVEEARVVPRRFSFALKSNPARGRAVFNLEIPETAEISLKIYDVVGRLVDRPVAGRKLPGRYEIPCRSNMSSGVYFYRLETPWGKKTGKLVLIR